MTNAPKSIPNQPERLEQMVAYLDGELSAEETACVEQRLASEEDFRQELQSIERAWAALDQLPRTTVEDRFAKTTMEMVVQTAQQEVDQKTRALPIQKRKRSLSTGLLLTTAVLLGGLAFRSGWKNPNRFLLADLPMIQNIDAYSQFHKADFLRQLGRTVKEDAWPTSSEELASEVRQLRVVSSEKNRQEWLEKSTDDERATLRAQYNRFRSLPEERKEQLRQLHEEIDSAKDGDLLRKTMLQYQQWLSSLPASQQYELRALSTQERVRRVARRIHQQAVNGALELTPKQVQDFFEAVRPQLRKMREQALREMSPREREQLEALPRNRKRPHWFWLTREDWIHRAEEINQSVSKALPEEKRAAFQRLSTREKRDRFLGWLRQATTPQFADRLHGRGPRSGEVAEHELEAFFVEKLDAATQERLLAMPREKMQQQLKRMVHGSFTHGNLDRPHGGRPPGRPGHPRARWEHDRRDGPPPARSFRGGPPRDQGRPNSRERSERLPSR